MQENPRGRVTGVCKLSEPVGLHPKDKGKLYSHSSGRLHRSSDRTLATQRSGKLATQRSGNCWSNQHQGKWKTMWIVEMLRRQMRDQNPFQKAVVLMRAAGDEHRNTPPLEIRCSGLTAVATRVYTLSCMEEARRVHSPHTWFTLSFHQSGNQREPRISLHKNETEFSSI